jgi:TatD DNase family protein
MVRLIDTHAHLCDGAFANDLGEVLDRARAVGVEAIVSVGEDLADARANLELADAYPHFVWPAAGLFPTILDRDEAEQVMDFMRTHSDRWLAVGEVGLDLWKVQDEGGRGVQREIFVGFIELARELGLPLNVHSRSAGRHTIQLLLDKGAERVQLHAFDGKAARALPAAEAGFFFSVPPSIVRSPQKQKLIKRLPLELLLLETDSPVLGPDVAQRNEPGNIDRALRAIAEIKGVSTSEVAHCVWENTLRLYGPRIAESSVK